MKRSPLHILLVEDNPGDVRSIWNMLREKTTFEFTVEAVSRLPAVFERLTTGGIDAILLDLALLTSLDETNAIESLVAAAPNLPVIVLTVLQNEHEGILALQAGAQDYLLKEEMGTRALVRALHYATERKQAEARLNATERRLQLMMNSITDYAIITLDDRGYITTWSVGAQNIFGYSANDIVGKEVDILFTSDDHDQGVPQRERQLAVETGVAGDERWLVRQDGSLFFASGELFPFLDETPEVTEFILVYRDMTLHKRAEEEQQKLLEREQAAGTALEKSLALLAHELRTPLTSIKGFASTLVDAYPALDAPTSYRYAKIIDEEADKLTDLTSLLFDLVRMRAGVFPIQPEHTHLEDIWAKTRAQAMTLTQQHHLILDLDSGLPPVMADSQRITQVFTNLIGNAAKFSPSQTEITVRAKPIEDFVLIEVSDQGIGIPVEDQDRVFEAFQQVENEYRRQGAGLGTAICKGIVEAHGGRIWVQEQSLPGTTIVFTLPIAQE